MKKTTEELTIGRQNSGAASNTYSKVKRPQVSPIVTAVISVAKSSRRERVAPDSAHRQFIGWLLEAPVQPRLKIVIKLTGKVPFKSTSNQAFLSLVCEKLVKSPSIASDANKYFPVLVTKVEDWDAFLPKATLVPPESAWSSMIWIGLPVVDWILIFAALGKQEVDVGMWVGSAVEGFALGNVLGILLYDGLVEGNSDDDGAGLSDGAHPLEYIAVGVEGSWK
jgi:hypothetical protein